MLVKVAPPSVETPSPPKVAAYTVPAQYAVSLIAVVIAYVLVNAPSVSAWVLFGQSLRGLLADPKRVRIFNGAMAVALVASLWPLVAEWR